MKGVSSLSVLKRRGGGGVALAVQLSLCSTLPTCSFQPSDQDFKEHRIQSVEDTLQPKFYSELWTLLIPVCKISISWS